MSPQIMDAYSSAMECCDLRGDLRAINLATALNRAKEKATGTDSDELVIDALEFCEDLDF